MILLKTYERRALQVLAAKPCRSAIPKSLNAAIVRKTLVQMARSERLELPTTWFEARCSIQLSYERVGSEDYLKVRAIGYN